MTKFVIWLTVGYLLLGVNIAAAITNTLTALAVREHPAIADRQWVHWALAAGAVVVAVVLAIAIDQIKERGPQ